MALAECVGRGGDGISSVLSDAADGEEAVNWRALVAYVKCVGRGG